jgi:hypothetical protein
LSHALVGPRQDDANILLAERKAVGIAFVSFSEGIKHSADFHLLMSPLAIAFVWSAICAADMVTKFGLDHGLAAARKHLQLEAGTTR